MTWPRLTQPQRTVRLAWRELRRAHWWSSNSAQREVDTTDGNRGFRGYARMGQFTAFVFIRTYPRHPRFFPVAAL